MAKGVTVYRPSLPTNSVSPSSLTTGGFLSAPFERMLLESRRKTLLAESGAINAATAVIDSRTALVHAKTRNDEALYLDHVAVERRVHDHALTRMAWADQQREQEHTHNMNETRRQTELTLIEVTLTDAHQQINAQREHGGDAWALKWMKIKHEIAGVQMDEAEMRLVMKEQREKKTPTGELDKEAIRHFVLQHREWLKSRNLDTKEIDRQLETLR